MSHLYILTTESKTGLHKVGIHTGSQSSLVKRYSTALPDLVVELFVKTKNAREVEKVVLDTFKESRVKNFKGNVSEWVKTPLVGLLEVVIFNVKWVKKQDTKITKVAKSVSSGTRSLSVSCDQLKALLDGGASVERPLVFEILRGMRYEDLAKTFTIKYIKKIATILEYTVKGKNKGEMVAELATSCGVSSA